LNEMECLPTSKPRSIARQEVIKECERQKAMESQRVRERNAVAIAEDYKASE
jgi:hypothetical protein